MVADIEIRYALVRDDSGIYTYSIFEHPPEYPATALGEGRFCAKLNDGVFDWMTVDPNRNMKMITAYDWDHGTVMNMKEARRMNSGEYKGQVEHKYDYSAVQFDTLAWGWSSTTKHIGLWFINPTIEYLSGGATKLELSAHRDATFGNDPNAPAPPCLLNYWRGSHYGGSSCVVAQGEHWTKVIGPFLIYCNAGPTPEAVYHDAMARSAQETKAWPFDWVNGVDYPHADQRDGHRAACVERPRPASRDDEPFAGWPGGGGLHGARPGRNSTVDWQLDAKHYEFWARGDEQGRFSIPAVRAGKYTLHAIATGVLGNTRRRTCRSTPANRSIWESWNGSRCVSAASFGTSASPIARRANSSTAIITGSGGCIWNIRRTFPMTYTSSLARATSTRTGTTASARADRPEGTTWSVNFDLPDEPQGKATLRLAFAATSASITVTMNDQPAGQVTSLIDTAAIRRDADRGYWYERDVAFDASLMKQGTNVLKLTIPPGNPMSGIEYDYLRLELQ